MGGTVNKNDALRIGRGIQDIERLTQKNTTGLNRPVRTKTGIPAKITEVGEFGLYSLLEQQINADGNGFEDKKPVARKWDGTEDELPQAFEINGTADLDTDLIVYIFRQSNDQVALNQWFFDSASNTGGTTTATDKSNTSIKGKIQFRNDIPFNANLQGPFDFEFQAPKQVGSLTDGNRAYGGNEDGVDNFAGIQRHYKWMWYKPSVTEGYLMPGTAAFKQSVSDEVGLQFLNQMWIRMDHRFDGQVNEVHHGLCAQAFFDQAGPPFPGRFSETPAGGVQATVWASATSGGVTNIKCEYDKTGHLRKLDDKYGDEDEYPTDVNIKQTSGTYPTSSSLYDTSIDQTSNLVDENNVDTDAFNGPVGTLSYTAIGANGTTLNIGFTVSTGFSLAAAATEYNGAGTGGNDDPISWDLSKHLDGSDVTLTSLLLEKNRSSTATITDVESVQLVTSIETTPVPDNSSFDVKVELQHGVGGTEPKDTEFIRFNANGEYRVVVFLFLKADAANFDPDDAATYLLKEVATVANQTTFSGGTVSFTFNFDDTDSGSDVCARAFLEFFKTLVNPQPLPNQIGFCDISNANDFDEDCQPIEGTVSTSTLAFASSTYNPESIGSSVFIDGFELRNINPIKVVYKIQKAGDTTEFTGKPSNFGVFTSQDVQARVSQDGVTDDFTAVLLTNPTEGQATDGFELTINYMEESLIRDGQGYVGKAFTNGVSDSPAVDEFSFNSASALLATDFFGDNSEDLPFPWPDNFDGTDQNSSSVGDTNWNKRWTTIDTDGTASITGGQLKYFLDVPAVQSVLTNRNGGLLGGDFSITVSANVTNFADTNGLSQSFNLSVFDSGVFVCQLNANRDKGSAGNFAMVSENTSGETTDLVAGGLNWRFKIERIDGTVTPFFDIGAGFVAGSRTENNSNVLQVDILGTSRWTGGNLTFIIDDFTVKVDDQIGTLVDFFSPNLDRWNDNNIVGVAYQIVNPTTNNLEQIIPASSGVDIIRLENLFAGGFNPNITSATWKVATTFNFQQAFAGSGTEEAFFQVENLAIDSMQIGWRDNGTGGQKFFVEINSVEQFSEANVTSSATATIERGDFTSSDFGGSVDFDNQKSLDIDGGNFASRWTVVNNTINATINASSEIICSGTTSGQEYQFSQTVNITGDFFVSVNFKNYSSSSPGALVRPAYIFITVGGVNIEILRTENGEASVVDGYVFQQGASQTGIEQSDSAAKIALRRVGSTITYEVNGSVERSVTQTGTLTAISRLSARHGNDSGSFTTTLFDFVLNDSGSEFLQNRVLFSNDDVFKFAFDDSNSPVTNIDIVTTTTLTTAFSCIYTDIIIEAPTGTQVTFDPSL